MEVSAMLYDILLILPEIAVAVLSMAVLLLGLLDKPRIKIVINTIAMAGLIAIALFLCQYVSAQTSPVFSHALMIDSFSSYLKAILLVCGVVYIYLLDGEYRVAKTNYPPEVTALILLSILGMMLLISANSLLMLYLAIELQSLAFYILAAIKRDNARSSEAGTKYFVLGALSSGLLLYGCSLIYGFSGKIMFADIAATIPFLSQGALAGLGLGLILLIIGLCFKLSAVPFHMWTPDVYEGSPTVITTLFATLPKLAVGAAFIRVLYVPFSYMTVDWQQIIVLVSILSMTVGSLVALKQTNIKRLLAYSAIGHAGYMLIGVASGSAEGVKGTLIYLVIYLLMSMGTFACVLMMRHKGKAIEAIEDLAGLSQYRPFMAVMLAGLMLSMAGIPPLAGFFGKFFVFKAAIEAELYGLVLVGILTSVIAAFYYIRIIKLMYFDQPGMNALDNYQPAAFVHVMAVAGLINLTFFIYPTPLLRLFEQTFF